MVTFLFILYFLESFLSGLSELSVDITEILSPFSRAFLLCVQIYLSSKNNAQNGLF